MIEPDYKPMTQSPAFLIGTAGWSIPTAVAEAFPAVGPHLQRYAAEMPVVEINSSFHRPHRRSTYERWAASTPERFRFSVKLPKEISHKRKLVDAGDLLPTFFEQVGGLGDKLGVILLQLPPSLKFDASIMATFLAELRPYLGSAEIACEPRHPTWFENDAEACLVDHRVARVAADPVLAPGGERPGGWAGLRYRRLHGSPRIYYSPYDRSWLEALAGVIAGDRHGQGQSWCIFDNTAAGAAMDNALSLQAMLKTKA